VNKRKIRVKDSINTVWWLAKTNFPKADVTKIRVPYSERMKKLLKMPSLITHQKPGLLVMILAIGLLKIMVEQFHLTY
jgi:hypothetical protein